MEGETEAAEEEEEIDTKKEMRMSTMKKLISIKTPTQSKLKSTAMKDYLIS